VKQLGEQCAGKSQALFDVGGAGASLSFTLVMGKLAPDFKAIADFRKDNIGCIKAMFREFVKLCMSLDLFGKKFLAIDGVKLKAINSIDRKLDQRTLANRLKEMDERYRDTSARWRSSTSRRRRGAAEPIF
jgi:hypothetical protein